MKTELKNLILSQNPTAYATINAITTADQATAFIQQFLQDKGGATETATAWNSTRYTATDGTTIDLFNVNAENRQLHHNVVMRNGRTRKAFHTTAHNILVRLSDGWVLDTLPTYDDYKAYETETLKGGE